MMLCKNILGVCIAFSLLLSTTSAHAQDTMTVGCLQQIYERLDLEQQYYRATVFGQPTTEDSPVGAVRMDEEGTLWVKTEEDLWEAPGLTGESRTNDALEDEVMIPSLRGFLEMRRTATSELLPMLLHSMRAFSCATQGVCDAAKEAQRMSQEENPDDEVIVEPEGCIEYTFQYDDFSECTVPNVTTAAPGKCEEIADDLIEREMKVLELTVSYDAAYRSMVQFAGIFEGFMDIFQQPLLKPIWEMVRTLGALDNIPCFLSQCNE